MTLLNDPVAIIALLCWNIVLAEWLVRKTFFRHFGTALLVILLTAIAANLRLVPANASQAPVYSGIIVYVAPLAIFFPLLRVNFRSVLKAGGPMIAAFLLGAVGTVAGVLAGMALIDGPDSLGEAYRPLGGMFTGTYIGGGVNFNALALIYGFTDQGIFFAGANAVDNILTALWMIICIGLPRALQRFRPRTPPGGDQEPEETVQAEAEEDRETLDVGDLAFLLALGGLAAWLSETLSAWTAGLGLSVPSVLILTSLALLLAQVPAINRLRGSRLLGMFAVYLFLAVIGAFCDLTALQAIGHIGLVLMVFGSTIVAVHGLVIFLAGALLKFDWAMTAVASQANIGGPTSALALARSLGRFDLVLPAVLVGSLGYGLGTYVGVLVAEYLLW